MRFFAVLLMLFATPALAQAVSVDEVLQNAVDQAIRPGFAALSEEATKLEVGLSRLCAKVSDETLAAAREQFAQVATGYARVEFLRFGPLMEDNRAERMLFFPDRKGIALRQVQQVLAEKDETAAEEATLRQKSVALQGLGALEFVLHGTGAEELLSEAGDFRCRYGHAVAAAVATTAGELAEAWLAKDGIAAEFSHPSAESATYRTQTEALEALTGAMLHGIEAIRDAQLLPFLGRDGEAPKPRSARFWRSALTVPAIRADFEGIATLFEKSRIGEASAAENLWVDNGAKFEFANALRAASTVTLSVEQALADASQRKALGHLVIITHSLETLVGEDLAAALGPSVGFSPLDGD